MIYRSVTVHLGADTTEAADELIRLFAQYVASTDTGFVDDYAESGHYGGKGGWPGPFIRHVNVVKGQNGPTLADWRES